MALTVAPPASAHKIRFDTALEITRCVPASCPPTTTQIGGRLVAERDKCEPNRAVALYRQENQALIGSSLSVLAPPDASWDVNTGGSPGTGTYYAVADRKVFSPRDHRHICRGDVSNTVSITSS